MGRPAAVTHSAGKISYMNTLKIRLSRNSEAQEWRYIRRVLVCGGLHVLDTLVPSGSTRRMIMMDVGTSIGSAQSLP